jgi:hypothetical protein
MKPTPTLVLIGHREINGVQFHHGDELPPNLLPQETVDRWLDVKWLVELDSAERRSLYRIFHRFSGVKKEPLDAEELNQFELPK